jgi:outer membrane usher protein FimD/PapC
MTVIKQSRLAFCVRAILCGTLPLVLLDSTSVLAREVTFDTGIMQTLGLNRDLNHYFAEAPRFLPGTHSVSVKVNGKSEEWLQFVSTKMACFALTTISWSLPG